MGWMDGENIRKRKKMTKVSLHRKWENVLTVEDAAAHESCHITN